jgi:hypothetical protein
MASDGKIKRTSFARRVAPLGDYLHIVFAPRGAIETAKRGGAFFFSSLLSVCRETAVTGGALAGPPLLRHGKHVRAAWRLLLGWYCRG